MWLRHCPTKSIENMWKSKAWSFATMHPGCTRGQHLHHQIASKIQRFIVLVWLEMEKRRYKLPSFFPVVFVSHSRHAISINQSVSESDLYVVGGYHQRCHQNISKPHHHDMPRYSRTPRSLSCAERRPGSWPQCSCPHLLYLRRREGPKGLGPKKGSQKLQNWAI